MENNLKTFICDTVEQYSEDLNKLSQDIWSNPELGFEEIHAHSVLSDFLERHGFTVTRSYKLDTAFKAEYGSDIGANIAILCEYDALPDVKHGCGHNLIAEVGIAAGTAVKAAIQASSNRKLFKGKVTVIGTPAEEGGGGKEKLIEAGAFDGIDAAMMAHPSNITYSHPPFLAMRMLKVEFRGKAAHGASAWNGINALDAAVIAYQSISNLRQQLNPTYRVNLIISKGGAKANIVPELSEMSFNVRCPTMAEVDVLYEKVINCCHAAALATGCKVHLNRDEEMHYSDIIHNKMMRRLYEGHAVDLGLHDDCDTYECDGSTDMGNVTYIMPGIHPHFRIGDANYHTREFCTVAGSKYTESGEGISVDRF